MKQKKKLKNKKILEKNKLILILTISFVVIIILSLIIKLISGKKPNRGIDNSISQLPEITDFNLKQDDYIIEGKVEATEFRVYYNTKNKKWSIDVKIENKSLEEASLEDYGINIYDKNDNLICKISKGVAGKIGPKESLYVIVETQDDLKNADHIDMIKNN